MKLTTDKLNTNIWGMLLAVIGFGFVAVVATIGFAARDPVWFLTNFDEKPGRIIIYQAGKRIEMQRGDRGFDELAEAVRASLAQGVSRPSGIGLSEGSRQDAYQLYVTVEAFFDQPVKLHASFNTGQPTQMLFPITGRHSDLSVVFLGREGAYMSGAPALKTTEPIRAVLTEQGYLK